jgi:hypothetical protein
MLILNTCKISCVATSSQLLEKLEVYMPPRGKESLQWTAELAKRISFDIKIETILDPRVGGRSLFHHY